MVVLVRLACIKHWVNLKMIVYCYIRILAFSNFMFSTSFHYTHCCSIRYYTVYDEWTTGIEYLLLKKFFWYKKRACSLASNGLKTCLTRIAFFEQVRSRDQMWFNQRNRISDLVNGAETWTVKILLT